MSSHRSSQSSGWSSSDNGSPKATMLNTGFLYGCGDRSGVYDETGHLWDALVLHKLVSDWPNMDRVIETCCPKCWSIGTSPALVAMRSRVLRYQRLGPEHAHSLLVMLYHLANQIVADPTPVLLELLAKWAQAVGSRYVTDATHLDRLQSAIWAKTQVLVAEDAVRSIKAYRSPADSPSVAKASGKREYLAAEFTRLERRDHELRRTLLKPWPVYLTGPLFALADRGIRYAAIFQTTEMDLVAFGQAFQAVSRKPHDYSIYAYHSKLVDAVKGLKLKTYELVQCTEAAGGNVTVRSREELRAAMAMVGGAEGVV
ncbi:hypothetical protein PG997_010946 [Apiospora hydei]|uniref:Uncharacterized protein n=1 Tax=Apiospora hydei TaxID=1337664 RepID=A0ABR1VLK7_9PEZI